MDMGPLAQARKAARQTLSEAGKRCPQALADAVRLALSSDDAEAIRIARRAVIAAVGIEYFQAKREQAADAAMKREMAPTRADLAAERKAVRLANLTAKMAAKGWNCEHVSTSGSQYWRTLLGYTIRISDHDIPLFDGTAKSQERLAKIDGPGLGRSWKRTIWI
jgi:hypothetical protein